MQSPVSITLVCIKMLQQKCVLMSQSGSTDGGVGGVSISLFLEISTALCRYFFLLFGKTIINVFLLLQFKSL